MNLWRSSVSDDMGTSSYSRFDWFQSIKEGDPWSRWQSTHSNKQGKSIVIPVITSRIEKRKSKRKHTVQCVQSNTVTETELFYFILFETKKKKPTVYCYCCIKEQKRDLIRFDLIRFVIEERGRREKEKGFTIKKRTQTSYSIQFNSIQLWRLNPNLNPKKNPNNSNPKTT